MTAQNLINQSADKAINKIVNKKQAVNIAFQNLINGNNNDKDILRSASSINDADIEDLDDITNIIDMFITAKKSTSTKFKITLDDTELISVKPIN